MTDIRTFRTSQNKLAWLTLLMSSSTLICCALPILLVFLGMGTTVAALTSSIPALITLSQHKIWLFGISALLLLVSGWLLYRSGRTCPTDTHLGSLCQQSQKWNSRIYWFALGVWSIGFLAAYVALPVRVWLDG